MSHDEPIAAWRRRLRWLTIWRFERFGEHFAVNLSGWVYFTNHSYPGERRYFVRLGEWRRGFGATR